MATAGSSKKDGSVNKIIEGLKAMSLDTGMFKLEAYQPHCLPQEQLLAVNRLPQNYISAVNLLKKIYKEHL